LFRMRRQTGLPLVTFRPPFVYGPGNPFYREQFFWDRLRAGRPLIIPGDGYRLMQFVYVNDLVDALIRAMSELGRRVRRSTSAIPGRSPRWSSWRSSPRWRTSSLP